MKNYLQSLVIGVAFTLSLAACSTGGSSNSTGAIAPAITAQPQSLTVMAGQTATFSVAATGTAPLAYQWQRNGANIPGGTSTTLQMTSVTPSDNGTTLQALVSNAAGSVTSAAATLTVNSPPSITTQPANQSVTLGQTATFSVVASGAGTLTYQWTKNGSSISGATAPSFTTPATTAADNDSMYQVVVTDQFGSTPSNTVTLTVNSPPSITTQPANQSVTLGQTATFSVVASGAGTLTYQWTKNGSNISGATAASYTTPATVAGDNNATFQVVVTNAFGSTPSNMVTLTVNSPPAITTQPANQSVTLGQTATFSVVAAGTPPLTYQWQENGMNISGATSSSFTTAPTVSTDTGSSFDVIVSSPFGSATSMSATLTVTPPPPMASVLTQHYDNMRTGQNTNETILTTSNVNSATFGKLFSQPVDGQMYAQPLYVPGVSIPGAGAHNVVFAATENDSVYAFDADSNSGTNASPLWQASLIDTAHGAAAGATPVPFGDISASCTDMQPVFGITATPVIDPVSGTMYVVAKSKENGGYVHRLHAIDITTGNEKVPGPVVISATVSGTGDGSSNGQLAFDPLFHNARPGLLLMNGTLYIGFASHCDTSPYHGWLFAYNASTFAQQAVLNTTPNGGLGGIWMAGAGLAADTNGNLFVATGNGTFDTTNVPATELGETIMKLSLGNGQFNLLDYFTAGDQATLTANDTDLGSGGVLLLPDQAGVHPHVLVESGKEGRIYEIDRDTMTTGANLHYCPNCVNDTNIFFETGINFTGGMFSCPAYWNGSVYVVGNGAPLVTIPLTNGLLNTSATDSTPRTFGFPGATPVISSNGTTSGIVWVLDTSGFQPSSPSPAVLRAYDATNLGTEFYDTNQAPANRDQAGNAVKFAVPVVVNGKVYVGTAAELDVYGLLP